MLIWLGARPGSVLPLYDQVQVKKCQLPDDRKGPCPGEGQAGGRAGRGPVTEHLAGNSSYQVHLVSHQPQQIYGQRVPL